MPKPYRGGCLCGAVGYQIDAEPARPRYARATAGQVGARQTDLVRQLQRLRIVATSASATGRGRQVKQATLLNVPASLQS
jgi:hypothetical protein